MSQFSTNEAVSLEKTVELTKKLIKTNIDEINAVYEIDKCAEWIKSNNYKRVCLQFPDYLLPDSSQVAMKLQEILDQRVYILGDTAYESCCIDYVAAAHITADAIIHFGPTCFSKSLDTVPYLYIYEKNPLSVDRLYESFNENFGISTEEYTVLIDTPYICHSDKIRNKFENHSNIKCLNIDENELNINDTNLIVISENNRKLLNLSHNYQVKSFFHFNSTTESPCIEKYQPDAKIIKRRYFLIEKIKDSKTLGIVIGTLAVKNYLDVIERMKKLIDLSGKKYYLISVGKPTVAKLANFPEVDVYVIITCSMNEIYESRDFYKPIVTPYDVEVALNVNSKNLNFSYDYNNFLSQIGPDDVKIDETSDVSLLTGNIRSNQTDDEKIEESNPNKQLVKRSDGTIVHRSFGAGFLADRTWKGLEQNLGQTDVRLAEEGRKGIAQGYQNEVSH